MASLSLTKRLYHTVPHTTGHYHGVGKRLIHTSSTTPTAEDYLFITSTPTTTDDITDDLFFMEHRIQNPKTYTFADIATARSSADDYYPGDKVIMTANNLTFINDSLSVQSFSWLENRYINNSPTSWTELNEADTNINEPEYNTKRRLRFDVYSHQDVAFPDEGKYYSPEDLPNPYTYITRLGYGSEIIMRMDLNDNLSMTYDTRTDDAQLEWEIWPLDHYPNFFEQNNESNPPRLRYYSGINSAGEFQEIRIWREPSTGKIWLGLPPSSTTIDFITK